MKQSQTQKIRTWMLLGILAVASCPIFAETSPTSLEEELTVQLGKAQDHYQQLSQLSMELNELQSSKATLQSQITAQKERLAQKKQLMAQRLQALQVSDFTNQAIFQLLDASSVTELIQRFLTIQDFLKADSDAIKEIDADTTQLQHTQAVLASKEEQLTTTQQTMVSQTDTFNHQIASLKQLIADHKEELLTKRDLPLPDIPETVATQTTVQKTTEAPTTLAALTTINTTTSSPTPTSEAEVKPTLKLSTNEAIPTTTSKEITVVATGYSYTQPGLNNYTATGIDLRKTTNVIAVDPAVIPLGSIVEIPGYGIAIAGDTGGDIKGNRIDLHYASVDQAITFGRQQLTIRVIE